MQFDQQQGMDSPQIVWTYTRREKVARIVACQPEFVGDHYHALLHPNDIPSVLAAIKGYVRHQKRRNERSGQFVNRHRLRNALGHYSTYLSLITLTRDTSNRLAFVIGVDYLAPANPPTTGHELRQWVRDRQHPTLAPVAASNSEQQGLRRRSDRRFDPFSLTWHCAGYVISPSLFRMVGVETGESVELTRKQARFVALLLGSRNSAGVPVYVERERTRRHVFEADAQSRVYDNDIDQLVRFFRQLFGCTAIGTKRGHGHILRAQSHQCSDNDAQQLTARAN